MSDVVDVDPEALAEHATAVRAFMGELAGATAEAGDTFDLQAYGIACIEPAQILQVWIGSARDCIAAVIEAGNGVADAVSSMAEHYRAVEERHRGRFDAIHRGLEGGR